MKYNKLIITMLLVPLILLFLVEVIILIPLKNDNYFISSLIKSRMGQTTCVIAGDSHPASAFRGELRGRCDNLSTGGTSTWMVIDLMDSVSKMNQLETAIISIGPHYFSRYRIENKSDAFDGIAEWFNPLPSPLSQNEAVAGFLIKWVKEKLGITNSKSSNSMSLAPKRIDQHAPFENWLSSDVANHYKKMIKDLINEGVNVCIIRTPIIEEYEVALKARYNENDWQVFIKDLQNTGAFYIPYTKVFDSYPREYFVNPEHLNPKGAKIYAPELLDICLSK